MSRFVASLSACWLAPSLIAAAPIFPDPPAPGSFVADRGAALGAGRAELDASLAALHAETGVPFIVAALPSLAAQGADSSWTHDRYADALFAAWSEHGRRAATAGDGDDSGLRVPAQFARRGYLLVVFSEDRRLALASGFERAPGASAARLRLRLGALLDEHGAAVAWKDAARVIAAFARDGDVSLPGDITSSVIAGLLLLACLITVVAYFRQGASSAPCRFWIALFSALGALLAYLLRRGVHWTSSIGIKKGSGERQDRGRVVLGAWSDR